MIYLISFILGLISSFGQPPYNFIWSAILAFALFIYFLNQITKKKALFSFCFGYGYAVYSVHWFAESLYTYGDTLLWLVPISLIFMPVAIGLYFALFGFLIEKFNFKSSILLPAILWMAIEFCRSALPPKFSWLALGYIWSESIIIQNASIFGIWGISFLTFIWADAIAEMIKAFFTKKVKNLELIVISCLSFLFCAIYGASHLNKEVVYQDLKVRIIQPNIDSNIYSRIRNRYKNLIEQIKLSKSENKVDYVIWPEGINEFTVDQVLLDLIKDAVPNNGELIFSGIRFNSYKDEAWNTMFIVDQQGKINNFYDKIHLVPFGEYIPFNLRKIFPFINKITPGEKDFSEGDNDPVIKSKIPFLARICYEATFTDSSKNDFTWMVNITNDGWFGKSIGPLQHLSMSRVRAIEQGVPMARSALTGVSAIIDSFGKINYSIPLLTQGIIEQQLPGYLKVKTPYRKYNSWMVVALMVAIILLEKFFKKALYKYSSNQ